jgi:hypothetical protein
MPRSALLRVAVLLPLGALLAGPPGLRADGTAPSPAFIQATDLLKVRQLESPALSPNGKWVVYAVRSIVAKAGAKEDWDYQTHHWLRLTAPVPRAS